MSAFEIKTVLDIVISTGILILVFSVLVEYVRKQDEK